MSPGGAENGSWYDCRGEDLPLRTLWLPDGDDLVAHSTTKGSGLLLVRGTPRRIVHPPIAAADGLSLPALVEYRLLRGCVLERGKR
jgi:hypothetical protein